ncbi:MAG: hypothetical protein KF745_06605 [Phycisphaeraceae bacterium]|nr:hypothetical protein [Phycisphaeraceae bacterium]
MSFMRTCAAVVAAGVLSLGASTAVAQETIDLKPKFEKGSETRYTLEAVRKSTTDVVDQPEVSGFQEDSKVLEFVVRVKEVTEEGGATVELEYLSVRESVKLPMESLEFDSAKPKEEDGDNPLAPMMRPVVGLTLTLQVDAAGKITSATGGDVLASALTYATEFGEQNSVKSLFGPLFSNGKNPATAAAGDTWTVAQSEGSVDEGGQFNFIVEHTLESIKDDRAEVKLKGRIETEPMPEDKPVRFVVELGTIEGRYTWDAKAGGLAAMVFHATFAGRSPETQKVQFSVKSDQTVTFTRKP